MKLSNSNPHQVLRVCFQRFAAYKSTSQILGSGGGRGADHRVARMADDKLAASVIGHVDRMDPVARAYCYFCFAQEYTWEHYCALVNAVHENYCVRVGEQPRAVVVFASRLASLAPYEFRYRQLNPTQSMHSFSQLADLIGITKGQFKNKPLASWNGLLDEMALIAQAADDDVEVYVRKINGLPADWAKAS